MIQATGYWTFSCNPRIWEVDKFLNQGGKVGYFRFSLPWYSEEIHPGQLALVRVGHDKRTIKQLEGLPRIKRGIYAVVEILSAPTERTEPPDKFWLDWQPGDFGKPVVKVQYIHNLIDNPLLYEWMEADPIVRQDRYLVKGFRKVIMPLRADVFKYVLSKIA